MNEKELKKYFEEGFLRSTCFDDLKDLLKDKTNWQANIVRYTIAIELKGVWRGIKKLNKEKTILVSKIQK